MNKLMAILFLIGALGAFGLSQRTRYEVQDKDSHGFPVSAPRTVSVSGSDRTFLIVLGATFMVGGLYFVARMRRDDAGG